jgi:hypothetical protein
MCAKRQGGACAGHLGRFSVLSWSTIIRERKRNGYWLPSMLHSKSRLMGISDSISCGASTKKSSSTFAISTGQNKAPFVNLLFLYSRQLQKARHLLKSPPIPE